MSGVPGDRADTRVKPPLATIPFADLPARTLGMRLDLASGCVA
jgi:hypothetical protein